MAGIKSFTSLILVVGLLLVGLLLVSATPLPTLQTEDPTRVVPPGFQPIASALGIQLYKKDYPNGNPDFVQVIDLQQGAYLKLLHGSITESRPGKGVYGGDDPRILSTMLNTYWLQISSSIKEAFCVTNGQFFYMPEHPTRLAFPLKVDGKIISDGWAINQYPDQKLILELWEDHADIRKLTRQSLYTSTAPNIIAGLTESANKRANRAVGRTFIGIDDRDGDSMYETVLILNTLTALQTDVAEVLSEFGAEKVMMLDGGGSTQLICKGTNYIKSERPIPQAIAVIAATPPPVNTTPIDFPKWQVLLEGEHFPFRVEIRNTGNVSWKPEESQFVLDSNPLGARNLLHFSSEIKPGESVVITHTLASYSSPGVFPVQFKWGIQYNEKTYWGTPLTTQTIVIPNELASRQGELQSNLDSWTEQEPQNIEALAMKWIEDKSGQNLRAKTAVSLQDIHLTDAIWIPIVMLPIGFLVLLLALKTQKN